MRVTVALRRPVYETLRRLVELQKQGGMRRASISGFVSELLDAVHEPLMRTVALLEAARDAPLEVRVGLRRSVEALERELVDRSGATLAQMDWLLESVQEGAQKGAERPSGGGRRRRLDPRVVTTGVRSGAGTENQRVTKRGRKGRKGAS